MSWTSRLGHLGRFSPFTRSPNEGAAKVSDADFSYITADDLRNHQVEGNRAESSVDYGPPRDTDVLILRSKKKEYHVHFPAYSIAKGEVTIREVREHAARKTSSDPPRVKLLYKGTNLKDDSRTAHQEGLRDGAEIMCAIAETIASESDEDEEDDEFTALDNEDQHGDGEARRRRNRGKKTKRRNKRGQQGSGTSTPQPELNLGVPPAQTSRAPSPKQSAPTTPLEKIAALRATLHTFIPEVNRFLNEPPPDQAKREFEHKRLSETILTDVLLKLDAVETEGDPDARTKRKELVRETQNLLHDVDAGK